MTFKPYTAPNAGDGPIDNAARDIGHRLNPESPYLVTEQTVAAVAWLLQWGHLKAKEEKAILDGLGLEWREERMGGMTLRPRAEFAKPESEEDRKQRESDAWERWWNTEVHQTIGKVASWKTWRFLKGIKD